ncbi:MAG: RNA polymerase subunit sigma-24 [Thalassobius sp.]|nr:RNA polymerase subunit sigma-24 [Thalassovita sp.]
MKMIARGYYSNKIADSDERHPVKENHIPKTSQQKYELLEDKALWKAFREGDQGAFSHIYKTYVQTLFTFGCQIVNDRELVKDCIQNLFIDLKKPSKKNTEILSIKSYLFKSMYRRVIRMAKRENRYLSYNNKWETEGFMVSFSHERTLINEEILKDKKTKIEKVVNELPNRQREAFLYHFYEGLSYEEVAHVMDLQKVHSARKLIYKAIGTIKEKLNPAIVLTSVVVLLLILLLVF